MRGVAANKGGTARSFALLGERFFCFRSLMTAKIFTLPDHLSKDLDIVFVGLNPSKYSAQEGHYFARPGNLFWTALNQSGLVPEHLSPKDDSRLLQFHLGLTDMVKRPTRNIDGIPKAEFVEGGRRLMAKLIRFEPRIICFVGLEGYRNAFNRHATTGPQEEHWGKSHLFIVPSTSRRNAFYPKEAIYEWFRRLKQYLDALKVG